MGSKDNICHLVTRVNQYEKNTEKINMLETSQVKGVLTTTDTIITQNCLQILPDSWFGFGVFLMGEIIIRASDLSDRYSL